MVRTNHQEIPFIIITHPIAPMSSSSTTIFSYLFSLRLLYSYHYDYYSNACNCNCSVSFSYYILLLMIFLIVIYHDITMIRNVMLADKDTDRRACHCFKELSLSSTVQWIPKRQHTLQQLCESWMACACEGFWRGGVVKTFMSTWIPMQCYATDASACTCTCTWCYTTDASSCTCTCTWCYATDASSCTCTCSWCYAMEKDIRWRKPAHNSVIACGTTSREYPQGTKESFFRWKWQFGKHDDIYIYICLAAALETKGQRTFVEKFGRNLCQLQALKRDPRAAWSQKKGMKCCEGCPKLTSSVTLPWLLASQINTSRMKKNVKRQMVFTTFHVEPYFQTMITACHPAGAVTMFINQPLSIPWKNRMFWSITPA